MDLLRSCAGMAVTHTRWVMQTAEVAEEKSKSGLLARLVRVKEGLCRKRLIAAIDQQSDNFLKSS